ncbi:MAG: hypothetical protein IAG10_33520 [Planctomycetaceae bacterium]|nr:hypothetical protein [Planctomycetaceae bacterium]
MRNSRSHAPRGNEPPDAPRPKRRTTCECLLALTPQSGGTAFPRGAWEREKQLAAT